MTRRWLALIAGALVIAGGSAVPAGSQEEVVGSVLTVNAAPDGAPVAVGERIGGTEFDNTRPIADAPVGPVPAFFADDEYGCAYATAETSGVDEWIAVARRGRSDEVEGVDMCPAFQTKLVVAARAGADALIVVNWEPSPAAGLGAGPLPGMMVGNADGNRLISSLNPASPQSVLVTFEMIDPDTGLPWGAVPPTRVTSVQATAADGTLSVGGGAAFGGQPLLPVGTDPEGDAVGGLAPPESGYDLIEALIGQPDPQSGDLRFRLRLAGMPPAGTLPEVARYIWDFGLEVPGAADPKLLSVEGRFTNVIRDQSTNIPDFILRGNCVTENNVTTCENLAQLQAHLNPTAAEITVTIPLSQIQQQAGGSVDDVRIVPASICEGISAKVAAYFSACGGDVGPLTGDSIVQDPESDVYALAARRVDVGIVPAGEPAAFTAEASLGAGNSYAASLDVSGLEPGDYEVHVRACYGTNCGTSSTEITL